MAISSLGKYRTLPAMYETRERWRRCSPDLTCPRGTPRNIASHVYTHTVRHRPYVMCFVRPSEWVIMYCQDKGSTASKSKEGKLTPARFDYHRTNSPGCPPFPPTLSPHFQFFRSLRPCPRLDSCKSLFVLYPLRSSRINRRFGLPHVDSVEYDQVGWTECQKLRDCGGVR